MLRLVSLFALATALVAAFDSLAVAQAKRNLVAVTPAEADADYHVQGEYLGVLPLDGYTGLQVVARGNGRFDAVLLRGGLPGAGWDRQTRDKLEGGRRADGLAQFVHSRLGIVIRGSYAWVYSPQGHVLGRLEKIYRTSPTMGLAPPAGAVSLFRDGKAEQLDAPRISPDGLLEVGATTKMPVHDFRLHLEFKTPYQPHATGQQRGNSGVYIQRRYEVQILDSFGLDGAFNECGSLYRQTPPDLNMAFPPLAWQTYDIWFTAARFDEKGKKIANARITVHHNGVAVHDNREIKNKTGAGQPEADKPLPIHFQNHGNPVHFRNVWIVMGSQTHPAEQLAQAATQTYTACCHCYYRCCRRFFR